MKIHTFGKSLIVSVLLTALFILLMSLGMYKFRWGEGLMNAAIMAVYGMATFVGGLLVGKKLRSRRFVWGLLYGAFYFALVLFLSWAVGGGISRDWGQLTAILAICLGSGMAGGMIS